MGGNNKLKVILVTLAAMLLIAFAYLCVNINLYSRNEPDETMGLRARQQLQLALSIIIYNDNYEISDVTSESITDIIKLIKSDDDWDEISPVYINRDDRIKILSETLFFKRDMLAYKVEWINPYDKMINITLVEYMSDGEYKITHNIK